MCILRLWAEVMGKTFWARVPKPRGKVWALEFSELLPLPFPQGSPDPGSPATVPLLSDFFSHLVSSRSPFKERQWPISARQSWGQGSGTSSSPHLRIMHDKRLRTLHQRQVVTAAQVSAQEKRGPTAAQRATCHHGHTISQELCLIQVVSGENQCPTWA